MGRYYERVKGYTRKVRENDDDYGDDDCDDDDDIEIVKLKSEPNCIGW